MTGPERLPFGEQPVDHPAWGRPPVGGWGAPGPRAPVGAPGVRAPVGAPGGRAPARRPPPGPVPPSSWRPPPYPARPEPVAPPSRRGRVVATAAAGLVLGIVAFAAFGTPGFLVTRVFDAAALQEGVTSVLTGAHGVTGVGPVTCEHGIPVTEGTSFECQVVVDGSVTSVPIRVTGDDGGYQVGRPA